MEDQYLITNQWSNNCVFGKSSRTMSNTIENLCMFMTYDLIFCVVSWIRVILSFLIMNSCVAQIVYCDRLFDIFISKSIPKPASLILMLIIGFHCLVKVWMEFCNPYFWKLEGYQVNHNFSLFICLWSLEDIKIFYRQWHPTELWNFVTIYFFHPIIQGFAGYYRHFLIFSSQ